MKPAQMRSRLSQEWDSRGWEYDLTAVAGIIAGIERAGRVDPEALAATVDSGFLARSGATRPEVADAIEQALGDVELTPVEKSSGGDITITAGGDVHVIRLDYSPVQGALIQGGIKIDAGGTPDDLLRAIGALVIGGLEGNWDPGLAAAISRELDGRDDVDRKQIEAAVIEAGKEAKPEKGRIETLIDNVATSSATSLLTTGITSGLVHLLPLLF